VEFKKTVFKDGERIDEFKMRNPSSLRSFGDTVHEAKVV
jgi:hypothetical protein